METICGSDCCDKCSIKNECKGCVATNGHPFGGNCVLASCCKNKKSDDSCHLIDEYKSKLIDEFNLLGIEDMPKVTELFALNGAFINLEYNLPNGTNIKFWNDNDIYLGNQLPKDNSDRCYGLTANDDYLLVCEYGENGVDPQIIVLKKRK